MVETDLNRQVLCGVYSLSFAMRRVICYFNNANGESKCRYDAKCSLGAGAVGERGIRYCTSNFGIPTPETNTVSKERFYLTLQSDTFLRNKGTNFERSQPKQEIGRAHV